MLPPHKESPGDHYPKGYFWREVKRFYRLLYLCLPKTTCKHWESDEHGIFCIYCDEAMVNFPPETKYTKCSYEEDFTRIIPYG